MKNVNSVSPEIMDELSQGPTKQGFFRRTARSSRRMSSKIGGFIHPKLTPSLITGAGAFAAGGIAAYTKKNSAGDTDWTRSLDAAVLGAEAVGLGLAATRPSLVANSMLSWADDKASYIAVANSESTWSKLSKSGLTGYHTGSTVAGAALGGFLASGSVFGSSEDNTFNWKAAVTGAAGAGALSLVGSLLVGRNLGRTIEHASKSILKNSIKT
jgi:hypothetical protein